MTARRTQVTSDRVRGAQRRQQPKQQSEVSLARRLSGALPWVLASMLLSVVLTGVIYLPRALDGYPVQSVTVEGVKDLRRQQSVQTALSELVSDENFFTVSLTEVYRQARALEWVEDVEVRRQWPGKLIIRIEERVPVAVWNDDVLVSNSGKQFRALSKYSVDALPHLFGPHARMLTVLDYYHSMSKVLAPIGRKIQRLDVDARLTAHLKLDDGVVIVVDREQYAKKLRRFVNVYDGILANDSRALARIDLRYVDGMAVQWLDATLKSGTERS
jgi:cell division protein FtsQ